MKKTNKRICDKLVSFSDLQHCVVLRPRTQLIILLHYPLLLSLQPFDELFGNLKGVDELVSFHESLLQKRAVP